MGGFSIRSIRPAHGRASRSLLASALALLALAALVTGCGSSASEPAGTNAPNNLLTPAELSRYPEGSVQSAFLNFWSDLQFRSWSDAAAFYSPAFRDFVGTANVIGAKKLNGSIYPLLKPTIVRIGQGPEGKTVYYSVRETDGTKELASIAWRDEGGNWQIVYDSRLDGELQQLAQNRVELERKGALPKTEEEVSPAAVKAGNEASQLQAEFEQRELKGGG